MANASSASATGTLKSGPSNYLGFRARETANAYAAFRLWDNAGAGAGTIVDTVALAPGESAREDDLVNLSKGLFLEIVSGAVEVSVRLT